MYITGIGRTRFGILQESLPELAYDAMFRAVKDSPLTIRDIDAIFVANFVAAPFQKQLHLNSVVSSLLPGINIPVVRIEAACAAGAAALYLALMSLGRFRNVMVLGVEKLSGLDGMSATGNIAMAGDRLLDQCEGLIFPANYALCAQQHMLKYGTTLDDFSLVSLKNHKNANLNELAHFSYKKVDLDLINNSPVVCSPLRLFDCSPLSDGAAALIVSRERHDERDVQVVASSMATDYISLSQRRDVTSLKAARIASGDAYRQAGLTPGGIDLAEVHDCFTVAELVAMEDLGFCAPGKGGELLRSGSTSLTGDLPINTDGGLKADGHPIGASGIAQVYELVTQLRGEAKKRQVTGAETGLSHNVGGIGGTCVVHILKG